MKVREREREREIRVQRARMSNRIFGTVCEWTDLHRSEEERGGGGRIRKRFMTVDCLRYVRVVRFKRDG